MQATESRFRSGFRRRGGGYDAEVAVTDLTRLDAHTLRRDFPIFEHEIHGKPLSYLDSASSSQKPRQVLDAMREFYETSYANVHRGVYDLAERATANYEAAREKVRALINAPSLAEVIFTRNVTQGLNLVAYAWGLDNLGPGDVAVVTELEHHANFVPWQQIAKRTGAEFRVIGIDDSGELRFDGLDEIARAGNVKVVAANLVSNTLGTINRIDRLTAWAHEQGAIMVVDAAQAVPHRRVDVQALGVDFLGFTSHKICGPTGAGALYGRRELLERMSPFEMGGEMIRKVSVEETTWNDLPYKFEAGTPAFVEAYGLGAAIDYVTGVGLEAIEEHEQALANLALERLGELDWITVYGPPAGRRAGIVSFNVEGVHPHDVAQILDSEGVAVRASHHCTQPLMRRLGITATARASFYLYSIPEEIDRLVDGLHRVRKVFA
jgi:cysteine desulfurase/selenocysteine lyase